MGIKCSLFGHAYGETTVEREREEQGSEVVITIREIESCRRCGSERVVSENKEVTTIETPDDVSVTGSDDDGVSDGPTTDTSVGAEIVDAEAGEPVSPTASDEPDAADAGTSDSVEPGPGIDEPEEGGPPVEDDGVILDDDEDEPDRDPGEWPEETDQEPADHGYGPEAADGIERFTDEQEAESDDEPADETAGESTQTAEVSTEPAESDETSEVWSKADPDLDADRSAGTVTVPDGEFHCPECGFSTPVQSSSLREGDFCPECHQDTLVHESG